MYSETSWYKCWEIEVGYAPSLAEASLLPAAKKWGLCAEQLSMHHAHDDSPSGANRTALTFFVCPFSSARNTASVFPEVSSFICHSCAELQIPARQRQRGFDRTFTSESAPPEASTLSCVKSMPMTGSGFLSVARALCHRISNTCSFIADHCNRRIRA